ncbi:hypothetical protein GCM10010425_48430 [Streptomyces spororaveus]|uniref:Uncharacterized protein n=1 Tax=Streptomyces spororaveus TaxID=284039 RepID=A0ABQ3T8C7_9ACTN|nr:MULTISPECIES: hypothetical protein [Streptomyces]MCX5302290.1 hypothetical protein [Streptomyces sp. NBC_00160]GHI76630.1 hypothetical protein Sspor_21910 [Streptomyces spororaveus]
MTRQSSLPPVWFRLPPGFYDIGPEDRATLDAFTEALGGPGAQQQLSPLMDGLEGLAQHEVVHTAFGFHPEEPTGVATSLFSLTVRRIEQPNPRLAAARAALAIARSPLWTSTDRRFIDLPSARPCCLVAGTISLPDADQCPFQARVVTVHPDGLHLLVLDLTSASTQHADAYTDILEAVAHTLGFSDPSAHQPTVSGTSRILEVLL